MRVLLISANTEDQYAHLTPWFVVCAAATQKLAMRWLWST
jgi:hypothetical protein